MISQLKKDELKNKWLVSNLNKKMFLGFIKVKNSLKKKRNQKCTLYDPRKEYLPFEYEYQTMYKEKYLKKLKGPKLLDLSILNFSKNNKYIETTPNNLLITENPTISIKHNKTESDFLSNNNITAKIFKNEEEKKIINELPFFSLFKNSKNNSKKREIKKLKEEFLYKISHNIEDSLNNNISLNNNTKFRNKYKVNSLNLNAPNKKIKLKLKIKNYTPEYLKVPILSTKERHLKFINNQLSLLKSFPNYLMKSFNDMITKEESEDEKEMQLKNIDDSSFNINNIKENKVLNLKLNINKNLNNKRAKTYNIMKYIPSVNKKLKHYPKNFYSIQQLMLKTKKYEKAHKEAFEEFLTKINIKEDYLRKLNYEKKSDKIYRPLTLGVMEPSKNLFKFKKITNKSNYLRESRLRDIIVSKQLRCEYTPEDIKRIINGKEPWKSCKIIKTNKEGKERATKNDNN